MVRKIRASFFVFLVSGLIFVFGQSCLLSDAHSKVLLGTLAIGQGDYQGATIRYLNALDVAGSYEPWIRYNLGLVYHSLGELGSAQNMWTEASNTTNPELLFALNFNQGVAWYESGRYDLAAEKFREALVLNPSSLACKINLELSLQKSTALASTVPVESQRTLPVKDSSDIQRLLEYVARKEDSRWYSNDNTLPAEGVDDW